MREPLASLVSISTEVLPDFVHRKDYTEGVDSGLRIKLFFFVATYEHSNQTVHVFVSLIILLLVAVELLAKETVPVPLELTVWGLAEKFTFKLNE